MDNLFCLAPCWTSTNASVLWISPNHSVSHIIHAFHVMASGGLANFESMVSHTLPSFYRTGQTAEVERCSSVHINEYIQMIGFGHRLEAINSAMFCSSNKMIDIAGVWSQHSSATCPRKSCKPTWRWEIEASPAMNINQLSSATFSHWPPWSADKGLCGSLKTGDRRASTAVWNPSRENVISFWRIQDVVKVNPCESTCTWTPNISYCYTTEAVCHVWCLWEWEPPRAVETVSLVPTALLASKEAECVVPGMLLVSSDFEHSEIKACRCRKYTPVAQTETMQQSLLMQSRPN